MVRIIAPLLAALVLSAEASNLREGGRKLQLANTLLNALIDEFTPLIGDYMKDELSYFDPVRSNTSTAVNLGNTTFEGACPESAANLTYGVGSILGLSNLNIKNIELVQGTEDLDVSFLALDGATWAGDWLFEFSWPNVTAETSLRLQANLCGFPIDQTLTGKTTVKNTAVVARTSINGETGNVLRFLPTSQVNAIVVDSVELNIGNVTADFGVSGSVVQQLGVSESLEKKVLTQFADDIEPFVINVANSYFETNAPFPLEQGASVSKTLP